MEPTHAPSKTQKELIALKQILHLTHHRNKNQHRLSKWYKSFSTFRHQVTRLLSEVQELDTAIAFSSSATTEKRKKKQQQQKRRETDGESKYVKEAREKVEMRVEFWERWQIEKWFVSFSNLTADPQYAPLGLMLLGCLAKARTVVRQFSKQDVSEAAVDVRLAPQKAETGDDLGEVISRDLPVVDRDQLDDDAQDDGRSSPTIIQKQDEAPPKKLKVERTPRRKAEEGLTAKPPKTKRKKVDAFDDLFSSLV